jgi:hypothetical protein
LIATSVSLRNRTVGRIDNVAELSYSGRNKVQFKNLQKGHKVQTNDIITKSKQQTDPKPVFENQDGFGDLLMSRIEKADKRIGVISVDDCINGVRTELHKKWVARHGE